MNFLNLIAMTYFCFVQVNTRSIPITSDVISEKEMKEKFLNIYQESKDKISWKKLKPILRSEVQRVRNVKGAEKTKINVGSTENTQVIHSINNDFSGNLNVHKKADMHSKSEQRIIKNIKSHFKLSNETFGQGDFKPNITDTIILEVDPTSTTKGIPYNITPDILTQGDLIVFLALNDNGSKKESIESEEFPLLNEGMTVNLQEISSTGINLLTDYGTEQNLLQTDLPTVQVNITDENIFIDFPKEDKFNALTFTFNQNQENKIEEMTTGNELFLSENSEISTNIHETQDTDLNFINLFQFDIQSTVINENTNETQFNDNGNKTESPESEETFLNERTLIVPKENVLTGHEYLSDLETNQNLFQTDVPTLRMSEKYENLSDLTNDHFNKSAITFNPSQQIEMQKISTNHSSINYDIDEISTDAFETSHTEQNISSFQKIETDEGPFIGPKLPKCPDPGICIFWFLAQDLCAENSHCHGALLCCMWGCSKMCVDGESDLL